MRLSLLLPFFALLLLACVGGSDTQDSSSSSGAATGSVFFSNESSYKVIVHRDAFSGAVLAELESGEDKKVNLQPSEHSGGTTFSVEYVYCIKADENSGEVCTKGIDPQAQFTVIIKEGETKTVQIPNPQNLSFPRAYFQITNSSGDLQIELNYLSRTFKQINGNIPIEPGQTGIYEMEASSSGQLYSNYTITSNFETRPFPDVTAVSGHIYYFTYSKGSVKLDSESSLIFK